MVKEWFWLLFQAIPAQRSVICQYNDVYKFTFGLTVPDEFNPRRRKNHWRWLTCIVSKFEIVRYGYISAVVASEMFPLLFLATSLPFRPLYHFKWSL